TGTAGVGVGSAGSWSAGMNHCGRDGASRPAEIVSATGSPAVQVGAVPESGIIQRSTTPCSSLKKATASMSGDQTGLNDSSSVVSLSSSAPFLASRITTSVPKLVVLVAATYLPSRDHEGE